MNISEQELRALGFRRAGTVYPDAAKVVRVEVDCRLSGCAVYMMVVDGEVMKVGTTGRQNSSFKARMHSTFSALRVTINSGPPYQGDPFKQNAPATVLAGREIELWAKESTIERFEIEETELNNRYRGRWTKETRAEGGDEHAQLAEDPIASTPVLCDLTGSRGAIIEGKELDPLEFEVRLGKCDDRLREIVRYLMITAHHAGDAILERRYVPKTGWGITYYSAGRWFCQFHPKAVQNHIQVLLRGADRASLEILGLEPADRKDAQLWVKIADMRQAVRLVPEVLRAHDTAVGEPAICR